MPIRFRENRYPGLNPHLQAALRAQGRWRGFHTQHLSDLSRVLDAILPLGYFALTEESFQLDPIELVAAIGQKPAETIGDVLVYGDLPTQVPPAASASATTPTLTLAVADALMVQTRLRSVVIYRQTDATNAQPVTRLELLSPSNKPGGSHYAAYWHKRQQALQGGLCLVEIDYLHDMRPLDARLPSYLAGDPTATPYHILVSDPRPDYTQGKTDVYGFGVLAALPVIPVPLLGADVVMLDLGVVYGRTFSENRYYWQQAVDYSLEPADLASFTSADQASIRQHMQRIARAAPPES